MIVLLVTLCVVLGLAVGSFLNVVIARLPRGESLVRPRSRCPACASPITARDNVPVLSWLLLRGRCRACGVAISNRYPLVEVLTGVVFGLVALRFGADPALPAFLYLAAVGIALAAIDLELKRLPNGLTLPSYLVGAGLLSMAAAAGGGAAPLVRALIGMVALFGFYFLLAFVYPAGMGFGDVKLAGVLGLHLGWIGWSTLVIGAFGAFLLGGAVAISLVLAGRAGRGSAIPFGPFMLLAALLAVLLGGPIAAGYMRFAMG